MLAAPDAKLAYARAAQFLVPTQSPSEDVQMAQPGTQPDAALAGPRVDAAAFKSHPAFCDPSATIAAGSRFGPGVVVGPGTRIGAFCEIGANCVIGANVTLGNRVRIGPLSSIGHAPFDFAWTGTAWLPLPGLAGVAVADDVTFGARVSVAAGCARPTTIGAGCKFDDAVHIGHDAVVGAHSVMAAGAMLAGYVHIGRACKIGGMAAVAEGIAVADRVMITATSSVSTDITRAGERVASGWPAMPARQWWRLVAHVRRLIAKND